MSTCPTCRKTFAAATFCPQDGARLIGDHSENVVLDNRYRLLRKVGSGGMGEVYEAEHVHIHRKVAVKILKPEIASDTEAIARLKREAQTTTGLGHPNIVDTLDFGHADGQAYLVMEWLDGVNLDQRIEKAPIDIVTALDIAAQAAAGLAEAHARGVIHRDVKPANLFLTTDRHGQLVVKIVDFGIAKLAASHVALTATGVLIGTPNYMAPEQALGEPIDERTDIYALGVILYEMVTGSPPFRGDTPLAVLHQHTSKVPVPPSESATDRGIERDLEAVILRCLEKNPADRYASMLELTRALDELRGERAAVLPSARSRPATLPQQASSARANSAHADAADPGPTSRSPRGPAANGAAGEGEAADDLAWVRRRSRRPWMMLGGVSVAVAAVGLVAFVILRGGGDEATRDGGAIAAGPIDGGPAVQPDAVRVEALPDAEVAVDAAPDPLAEAVTVLDDIDRELDETVVHKMHHVTEHGDRIVELVAKLQPVIAGAPALAKVYGRLEIQAKKFVVACKLDDTRDQYAHHRQILALARQLRIGLTSAAQP